MTKPISSPDMFPADTAGVRPVAGETHATAAQLAAALGLPGLDDAFLRNHHKDGIPKPVKGKYPINETIISLLKFYHAKAAGAGGRGASHLPDFASMELCETAGHIPRTMQKWAQKRGIVFQKSNKGVDYEALLRGLNEKLFTPMFSGDTSKISALGIGGMAQIDGQYEEDRLTRERADEQAMLNAEKRGEVLFSRDQQTAIGELHATEVLFEQFLAPFKKELLERAKREGFYDTITALLAKHMKNLPAEMAAEPVAANEKTKKSK